MGSMIEIKELHKSYIMGSNSLHVLKGINFNVAEGELVSIMGSSGSGKSTLLNILGMLDEADKGSYTLDGLPIKNLNEKIAARYRNQFLGFIFQSFNLISYKNALDNVALPLYYEHDIAQMTERIVTLKDGLIIDDSKVDRIKAVSHV